MGFRRTPRREPTPTEIFLAPGDVLQATVRCGMCRDSNGEVIEHRQRRRSLAIANLRRISRNELSAEASAILMPTLTMSKYLRSQYPSTERCMP
jgi:hypothetical protein